MPTRRPYNPDTFALTHPEPAPKADCGPKAPALRPGWVLWEGSPDFDASEGAEGAQEAFVVVDAFDAYCDCPDCLAAERRGAN